MLIVDAGVTIICVSYVRHVFWNVSDELEFVT